MASPQPGWDDDPQDKERGTSTPCTLLSGHLAQSLSLDSTNPPSQSDHDVEMDPKAGCVSCDDNDDSTPENYYEINRISGMKFAQDDSEEEEGKEWEGGEDEEETYDSDDLDKDGSGEDCGSEQDDSDAGDSEKDDFEEGDRSAGGRYFGGGGGGPKCFNCGQTGHISKDCSGGSNLPCFLCGGGDHQKSQCPEEVCYNCGRVGHMSRNCPRPRKRRMFENDVCNRCGLPGHLQKDCSLEWRRYVFARDLSKAEIARADSLLSAHCYNCAAANHWGDECPTRRRIEYSIFHRPMLDFLRLAAYHPDSEEHRSNSKNHPSAPTSRRPEERRTRWGATSYTRDAGTSRRDVRNYRSLNEHPESLGSYRQSHDYSDRHQADDGRGRYRDFEERSNHYGYDQQQNHDWRHRQDDSYTRKSRGDSEPEQQRPDRYRRSDNYSDEHHYQRRSSSRSDNHRSAYTGSYRNK